MSISRTVLAHIIFGSVLCLAAVVIADSPNAPNLLVNGSFEKVGDQPDQAAGWSRWGDWINREDSWTPTHEGKALIGYHHWQIDKTDDSGMWQDVTVQAGKKYQFTLFVQRDDPGTSHSADNVQLGLESTDSNPPKSINVTSTQVESISTGANWSKLTVEGIATSTSLRVLVRVTPSKDTPRGGAVKFDDASLVLVQP